jgi:hypothetical protein
MKYSIGHSRAIAVYINIESLRSGKFLFTTKNNCMDIGTAIINTTPKPLGYLVSNVSPCLFKNTFSSVYVTLFAFAKQYGTKVKVRIKNTTAKIGIKFENKSIKEALIIIPNQNIRFQKLSLLQRDFSQFINVTKLGITSLILAYSKRVSKRITYLLLVLIIGLSASVATAKDLAVLISETEDKYGIPQGLLSAIASVESGNKPYALNISGKSIIASSKKEAGKVLRRYLDLGYSNIDVGIMQVNWRWHGDQFNDIDEMLTVENNIKYAAEFLASLYKQHGNSWFKAVQHYHSSKPGYHRKYSQKILIAWLNN